MSDNNTGTRAALPGMNRGLCNDAPPVPFRLVVDSYALNWEHPPESDSIVLVITPCAPLGAGLPGLMMFPPQIKIVLDPEMWETFRRDVDRGGYSSRLQVAKGELPS